METPLVQLALAFPVAVEEQLLAELRAIDPDLPGFTSLRGQGHGHGYAKASVREQVRGRIDRGVLLMALAPARADAIVTALRERLPVSEIAWWIVPVLAFGRLGQ